MSWCARRTTSAAVCDCPVTSPFLTATPCWPESLRARLVIENYSTGADCASTLGCMRSLGVTWARKSEGENGIEVQGRGMSLSAPSGPLDCGNSGSTMRMLSGIVAGQKFASEMIGDESLSRRPMERVIKPLSAMGAQIVSQQGQAAACASPARR